MPFYNPVFCAEPGDIIWCSSDAFNVSQSEIHVAKRYYTSRINGKLDRSDIGDWLCINIEVKRIGWFRKRIVGAWLKRMETKNNG